MYIHVYILPPENMYHANLLAIFFKPHDFLLPFCETTGFFYCLFFKPQDFFIAFF